MYIYICIYVYRNEMSVTIFKTYKMANTIKLTIV